MSNPNPILVEVTRGRLLESAHRGAAAVVDSRGEVLAWSGDIDAPAYLRSSAKPMQVLPLILSGAAEHFGFSPQEAALMSGSHSGERIHTDLTLGILRKIGLKPEQLQCGVHSPLDKEARTELKLRSQPASALHNNCSAKHAAMLAGSIYRGYPPDSYLDFDHPWQKEILEVIAELAEVEPEEIELGVDGCGAPVHALPLRKAALAAAKLAGLSGAEGALGAACERVFDAMTRHPYLVAGRGRICTELIEAGGGELIAKAGAEGYYLAAFRDKGRGIGLAVKIDDGAERARDLVVVETLDGLGVFKGEIIGVLDKYRSRDILNHSGMKVGEILIRGSLSRPGAT